MALNPWVVGGFTSLRATLTFLSYFPPSLPHYKRMTVGRPRHPTKSNPLGILLFFGRSLAKEDLPCKETSHLDSCKLDFDSAYQ